MIFIDYYFASICNYDSATIYPRIPNYKMNVENDKTCRICVSQSINGCLSAIGGFKIGDTVYIHKCISSNAYQPTLKEVPDRCFTGEEWILEPIKVELFMKVVIIGMIDATINNMSNIMYGYKLCEY